MSIFYGEASLLNLARGVNVRLQGRKWNRRMQSINKNTDI